MKSKDETFEKPSKTRKRKLKTAVVPKREKPVHEPYRREPENFNNLLLDDEES